MTGYTYSPKTRQYHDAAGKVVALAVIIALRDEIADTTRDDAVAITTAYLARQLTLSAWADKFAALIQDAVIAGYLLGRGGQNAVTPADDARIAPILTTQLDAAKGFARVLGESTAMPMLDDNGDPIDPATLSVDDNGDLVDENGDPVTVNGQVLGDGGIGALADISAAWAGVAGLLNRAGSYESAAISGFSGGQWSSWGAPDLPDMPPQHAWCRCFVEFNPDSDGQLLATWCTQEDDRVCAECDGLAAEYSDYPTGTYLDASGNVPSDGGDGG